MDNKIKVIEDLSLNAWPSHQMQVYDGWILRFSYFYTCRTNCVEQIGASLLNQEAKIDYCETVYRRWQTPCIFKISPITDSTLPPMLLKRGYAVRHRTDVMILDNLEGFTDLPKSTLVMDNQVSYTWLQGLFDLKETTDIIHRRIVPSMYAAIPKDVISVCMMDKDQVIATGLGILDREFIGIYAIHVHEAYRRRGYARDIVTALLGEGRRHGAEKAYLQVVAGNDKARHLYESLGFAKLYDYHFLSKDVHREV